MRDVRFMAWILSGFIVLGCVPSPREQLRQHIEGLADGQTYRDGKLGASMTMHHRLTGQEAKDGWYRVSSTRGAFSVSLPGQAADYMHDLSTTDGARLRIHSVGLTTVEGVRFAAMCAERDDGKLPADFPRSALSGLGGKDQSTRPTPVKRGQWKGWRVTVDSLKSKFVGEAFLINGRGYSLLAEYPLSLAAVMPSTSERFFESLRPLR